MEVHLGLLLNLLDVARPGALFPETRTVREWLSLVQKPWEGRTVPKVELHAVSGFPTPRSLERLRERQRLARAFFDAHKTRPPRKSHQFNVALAAAELWAPGTHAKVMSAEKARARVLVVHDRFEPKSGTLVRFSAQVEQHGTKHVKVERGTLCTCTGPFELAVEQACDGDATAAAVRLASLEGLHVHEVVRGELGPFATPAAGAFTPVPVAEGEAVLSVLLERVGTTVAKDYVADAWPAADEREALRAAKGWRRSRERKLICTPGLLSELQRVTAGSRMLIRAR